MSKSHFTYILANKHRGTMYTGVTNDLVRRIYEHKEGVVPGFTEKYSVKRLVYFEVHSSIEVAIKREKKIKKWKRLWKFELIEKDNPDWNDLYPTILE